MEPQFYQQQNWNNRDQQRAVQQWPNFAPNGMPPVGVQMGFNMLPRQVINDAFTLSMPVKLEDEPLIIEALLRSCRTNENYKDALNSLHGVSLSVAFSSLLALKSHVYTAQFPLSESLERLLSRAQASHRSDGLISAPVSQSLCSSRTKTKDHKKTISKFF